MLLTDLKYVFSGEKQYRASGSTDTEDGKYEYSGDDGRNDSDEDDNDDAETKACIPVELVKQRFFEQVNISGPYALDHIVVFI